MIDLYISGGWKKNTRYGVGAGICKLPEEYKYSSASFYHTGIDNWGFLTHHRD
ncbi:MAG: hypothetical protein WDN26_20715 [Chitinophagaceae bacterium]